MITVFRGGIRGNDDLGVPLFQEASEYVLFRERGIPNFGHVQSYSTHLLGSLKTENIIPFWCDFGQVRLFQVGQANVWAFS